MTHKINDISVKNVKTHKHLGVILDQNLKFDAFCDLLVKNSFKKWSILKKNYKYADGITFLNLYKTHILSVINYCNIACVPNSGQFNRIERVQKKCTKFICFKFYENNSSYENRFKYFGLKSYKSRKATNIQILINF